MVIVIPPSLEHVAAELVVIIDHRGRLAAGCLQRASGKPQSAETKKDCKIICLCQPEYTKKIDIKLKDKQKRKHCAEKENWMPVENKHIRYH